MPTSLSSKRWEGRSRSTPIGAFAAWRLRGAGSFWTGARRTERTRSPGRAASVGGAHLGPETAGDATFLLDFRALAAVGVDGSGHVRAGLEVQLVKPHPGPLRASAEKVDRVRGVVAVGVELGNEERNARRLGGVDESLAAACSANGSDHQEVHLVSLIPLVCAGDSADREEDDRVDVVLGVVRVAPDVGDRAFEDEFLIGVRSRDVPVADFLRLALEDFEDPAVVADLDVEVACPFRLVRLLGPVALRLH